MRKTITIGIPAYNEERNIKQLVEAILLQKAGTYSLKKIVVSSDGSTDNTKDIVKSIPNQLVHFVDNRHRRGQAFRQNEIINECSTDILVLLNADIVFKDKYFIQNLIRPMISQKADLTSSSLEALKAKSFWGKMFTISFTLRNTLYDEYNSGNNLFTCHGAARAFSHKFYKNFKFENSVAEDAYSYLACISGKYTYVYTPKAVAFIRWPENLKDHFSQSLRYFQSKIVLKNTFNAEILNTEYRLPIAMVVRIALKFLFTHPVYATTYCAIFIYNYLYSKFQTNIESVNTWTISTSSKKLI